ncbi:hypothetical protein GF357_04795 [Candidatus Dojkabacteria bacterium]|nr:hypothetical protein [Candidatus Dojkabacteria bacterium]
MKRPFAHDGRYMPSGGTYPGVKGPPQWMYDDELYNWRDEVFGDTLLRMLYTGLGNILDTDSENPDLLGDLLYAPNLKVLARAVGMIVHDYPNFPLRDVFRRKLEECVNDD